MTVWIRPERSTVEPSGLHRIQETKSSEFRSPAAMMESNTTLAKFPRIDRRFCLSCRTRPRLHRATTMTGSITPCRVSKSNCKMNLVSRSRRTTTGVDGGYSLRPDIPVGNYRIVEFTPAGLIDGSSHVGRIDNVRVGTSIDGGLIQDIVMTPGGVGVEYDFCEGTPASISGLCLSRSIGRWHGVTPMKTRSPRTQVALVDQSGAVVATDAD